MKDDNLGNHRRSLHHLNWRLWIFCLAWLALGTHSPAALGSPSIVSAPKWGVFESSFKSSAVYAHPLADASLTVVFTSPLGDTSLVPGFWDGGKTWRVRFSPDVLGKWQFHTACSDTNNPGLNDVLGEFLCTPAIDHSNFDRHGPVRMSRDHRHLEYADRTPFFWLADIVWNGAALSSPADWDYYVQVRAHEKFTVAQWVAAPVRNAENQAAYTSTDPPQINLEYFKKLDAKISALNHAGILSAIVPHAQINLQGTNLLGTLSEPQAIVLLRYMVARWGANDVIWMLTSDGGNFMRVKHILHAVFGDIAHAPVIVYPGESYWVLEKFRNETLVDAFGYQSGQDIGDAALEWMLLGPVTRDWKREPYRPLINLAPAYENEPGGVSQLRNSASAVRRAAYWSVLNAPASGVSYGGHGVWDWETTVDTNSATPGYQSLANWRKALFMPAAKQMGIMADIFDSIDFWRLRPAPELLANQPGSQAPGRYIAAASTAEKDLAVTYVPEDREVELNVKALPQSPTACWINPTTAARSPVTISLDGQTSKLSTPAPGDWLLLIQSPGK